MSESGTCPPRSRAAPGQTICVTGLCLGGNKGGPALFRSLTMLLGERIKNLRVIMVSTDVDSDRVWENDHEAEIVPVGKEVRDLGRALVGWAPHKGRVWAYRESDLIINLEGVKFPGPQPVRSPVSQLRTLFVPWLLRKPTVCFTQTYGPFRGAVKRLACRLALSLAKLVVAREPQSPEYLSSLGLRARLALFPDVAIVLPATDLALVRCRDPVRRFVLDERGFVGICPSMRVVLEERRHRNTPRYEKVLTALVRWLLDRGQRVLFVPHTCKLHRPNDHDAGLAHAIAYSLGAREDRCMVVGEELPPEELKAIIAGSRIFIGSRYHALVAGLSSAVPSIAIGWNRKYPGLLGWFDIEGFAFDHKDVTLSGLEDAVLMIEGQRSILVRVLKRRLPLLMSAVNESVDAVVRILERARP